MQHRNLCPFCCSVTAIENPLPGRTACCCVLCCRPGLLPMNRNLCPLIACYRPTLAATVCLPSDVAPCLRAFCLTPPHGWRHPAGSQRMIIRPLSFYTAAFALPFVCHSSRPHMYHALLRGIDHPSAFVRGSTLCFAFPSWPCPLPLMPCTVRRCCLILPDLPHSLAPQVD